MWLIVYLNLPSQFQFYLILTLSLLIMHRLDVKGKLDTPSKVISKEAIEW